MREFERVKDKPAEDGIKKFSVRVGKIGKRNFSFKLRSGGRKENKKVGENDMRRRIKRRYEKD